MEKLVIGIDYGTDSCRALIVDAVSGKELATEVAFYPRWKSGMYCDPSKNQYRQHPQDYIDPLEEVIHGVLEKLTSDEIKNIVALGVVTIGSTPCLTERKKQTNKPKRISQRNPFFVFLHFNSKE